MVVVVVGVVTVVDVDVQQCGICRDAVTQVTVGGQVKRDVVPAGFFKLSHKANIPVAVAIHNIAGGVSGGIVRLNRTVFVTLRNLTQIDTAIERLRLNRYIHPHTERSGATQVNHF